MAENKQEKLSNDIKVSIANGVANIEHSDAYNAQQQRFFAGEHFTNQEKAANQKLIEAEEAKMEAARRDPVGFLKQQETHGQLDSSVAGTLKDTTRSDHAVRASGAQPPATGANAKLTDAERLDRARQAFEAASPEDRAIAQKNLEGVQAQLVKVPYMTHEFLVQAQQKAFMDEGEKLYEKSIAANKKDNALTWEVANFSQAPGKTLVNADAAAAIGSGVMGYGVSASHGLDAKSVGLTLAEANVAATTDSNGALGAQVGLRAVKQVFGKGDHNVFVAGAANATVSGIDTAPTLGGNATGLLVNTHQLGGRPTSEIVGAVVDVPTGNTTAVGSVSQTYNADTKFASTARAVGTYGVQSGAAGFSFELYQKTGIENLTARLSAGMNNVGETNDISVGAGVSMGF